MEIKAVAGDIAEVEAGAVLLSIFEGDSLEGDLARVDKALGGAISRLISQGEIKGKLDETNLIHSLGKLPAARVVVIGLGKKTELTLDRVRGAVAEACRYLQKKGVDDIATVLHGVGILDITPESLAQAVTEGALLGVYTFRKHMTKEEDGPGEIKRLSIVGSKKDIPSVEQGCHQGEVLAEAANLARDMVNEPANYMTPTQMAELARKLVQDYGLELTVLDRPEMEQMGMGALLGVAQGSCQPPKFIILKYKGKASEDTDLVLVGKGITFDSGGISLKPADKMEEMKGDMAGGAAVMAAISAVARLKPRLNISAVVPAVENLPGGSALKPGDILTAITGKTIEIISTDAEGRLILADALGYASRLKPGLIVDVATLTGACVIALGRICTGVFGNNQELVDRVVAASNKSGELMWQMPMYDDYKEQNKSDVADIKNVGGREAGAITAAKFLAEFVGDTPWAHLDIAGTSMSDKERKYLPKGATGVPVRTLVGLAQSIASRK